VSTAHIAFRLHVNDAFEIACLRTDPSKQDEKALSDPNVESFCNMYALFESGKALLASFMNEWPQRKLLPNIRYYPVLLPQNIL